MTFNFAFQCKEKIFKIDDKPLMLTWSVNNLAKALLLSCLPVSLFGLFVMLKQKEIAKV